MADDHTAGPVHKRGSRRAAKTWQEAEAARRPEEWLINDFALVQAAVGKFVTGLAFLALTWSTVVLLGGFVGAVRIKDFWALTVISFVLASTVLTVYDLDDEFSKADVRTTTGLAKAFGGPSLWFLTAGGLVLTAFFQLLVWGALILYGLGPIFCIGFSAQRVWEHDYGDADGVAANKAKLRSALLIFYSLVLLQTICFSTWMILQALLIIHVDKIRSKCGFGEWGGGVVSGYLRETKVKCANDLRLPGDWNLITYAVGLLESASPDDQLAAARVLDTLGGEEVSVRLELQSSRRSIKNLIGMLGWRSPDDREIRERAARIIADVSGELHITQFPGALQCISSLLDASQQDHDQETLALSLEGSSESSETSGQNDHDQGETAHQNSHNQGETACQNGDQQVRILSSGSSHRRTTGDKMNKTQKNDLGLCACLMQMLRDNIIKQIRHFLSTEIRKKDLLGVDGSFVPNGPKELIFQGVLILERLTQDQDNCSEICRNQGLVSQITGPITSNTFLDTDYDDIWVDILSTSLGMVSRLVSTPGEACQSLRDKIGRSEEAARNMLGILESGNNGYLRLQEHAIEILAEVALDMPTTTTTTKSFIRKLRCIFLDDANNSSNVVEEDKERTSRKRKKAGEALAKLLCVQGSSNSKAIMEMFWENGNVAVEQDPADSLEATRHRNVVDQLTDILVKNKLCQISAAEILVHLCSHFTKYRELPKQDVISLLTKVLEQVHSIRTKANAEADAGGGASNNSAVQDDVESQPPRDADRSNSSSKQNDKQSEERKLLAALLSLTTVICYKLIDADDFSPVNETFVKTLKEMIDNNNDTTADCLRFLKLTTQVVITMIRRKPSCIKDFEEHNFKESLSKALKRVSDLDNCMLFSRNNRIVARRFRSVSSLVKEAQKLLETKESSESVSNSSV